MGLHFRFSLPARVYLSFLVFFHLIISVRLECRDFGLRSLKEENNNEWKFYNIPRIGQIDCFLCALWETDRQMTFELALPCRKDTAILTGVKIDVLYFGTKLPPLQLLTPIAPKPTCESQYMSASNITGPVSSFTTTQDRTNSMLDFKVPPYTIRVTGTYPENAIVCIENVEYKYETITAASSTTITKYETITAASSTTITSKRQTTRPPANRVPSSDYLLNSVSTLASSVATTGGRESEVPKMYSRIITTNVKRNTTDVSQGILDHENDNGGTSLWIIIVAVVVILLLVLVFGSLLWYRSRRQKGGVAHPDKVKNNGTDVRGNQLVNHHGDVNNEMVYNGDPKYYSIEDGEVKIPTYALPDQEMCINDDSYETVDKKAKIKSKETLKTDHLKHFQHTNKSFEQIDKNKGIVANANGKMVDEASMREDNEYSRKIFTEEKEAVVFCDRKPQYINYKITGHTSN